MTNQAVSWPSPIFYSAEKKGKKEKKKKSKERS
jgi:hypothetical protein